MLGATITNTAIRFYPTVEAAAAVAAEVDPEDDWSYTIIKVERGFAIIIHDEDGEFLGHVN